MLRAQQRMKVIVDGERREENYGIGDRVYLKLEPYRQKSLARRPFEKLAARFYGPYQVLSRIRTMAYKLALPPSSKVHPVFHVSQLKRVQRPPSIPPTPLPEHINGDLELEATPEKLLGMCTTLNGDVSTLEVLIQWQCMSEFEATWTRYEFGKGVMQYIHQGHPFVSIY